MKIVVMGWKFKILTATCSKNPTRDMFNPLEEYDDASFCLRFRLRKDYMIHIIYDMIYDSYDSQAIRDILNRRSKS